MTKWFRTDGVRGLANVELTVQLAMNLGAAYVECLRETGIQRPRLVLGRDTRVSGSMLEAAFAAGACARGGDVWRLGIIPTPAVALLSRTLDGVDGGVMISASHNPIADNGVKLFGRQGFKISDDLEARIEAHLGQPRLYQSPPTGVDVGQVSDLGQAEPQYLDYLRAQAGTARLDGLKVVLDCAHGAAWAVAPRLFRELGAEVVCMHDTPAGERINVSCGSTNLRPLQARVLAEKAHVGLAFDGDADRCLAVDELGETVDGDQMLLVFSRGRANDGPDATKGTLPPVVATVMSNLGLEWALRDAGISMLRAAVGDRFVLESMKEHGALLGGEQSGHIIFLDSSTTGDGTLTGLRLALAVQRAPLSELARMPQVPQLLVNVRTPRKDEVFSDPEVAAAIASAEAQLAGRGRLLVRASGTEPLVRVMAEGPEAAEVESVVKGLAGLIEARFSGQAVPAGGQA